MAKILDRDSIDSRISKIVELDKGYVINGHYYKKNTLTPLPLKLFKFNGFLEDVQMERVIYPTATYNHQNDNQTSTIVKDDYDPDIVYKFIPHPRANSWQLVKLIESDTKVETVLTYDAVGYPTTGGQPHEYLSQDKDYIWMTFTTSNSGHSYIAKIEKRTLTPVKSWAFGTYTIPTLIYSNENWIYVAVGKYIATAPTTQESYMYRLNKNTEELQDMKIEKKTGKLQGNGKYTQANHIDSNTKEFYGLNYDDTTNKIYFVKYILNLLEKDPTLMIEEEVVPVVLDNSLISEIEIFKVTSSVNRYDLFISEDDTGAKYLNLAMYQLSTTNQVDNYQMEGIYTFKIRPTTLELTNYTQVSSGQSFRGFLLSKDKKFMVASTKGSVIFLNFDKNAQGYVINDTLDSVPHSVGLDEYDNVWITKQNLEVEMVSLTIPTVVDVVFEKPDYLYEGIDINTNISIEARNYKGDNIETTLDLTIDGNAVFTSNGKKISRELTKATGSVSIPIKITGAGNITIYPKFVTRTV